MKLYILILFITCVGCKDLGLYELQRTTSADDQLAAANQVIVRLLGNQSKIFRLAVDENLLVDGKDSFAISKLADHETVNIAGSSGVAVTWAVHYYLKNYCGCHISWDGDQLTLPKLLPDAEVSLTTLDRWRYYQNVVTAGYSFVWYDWTKWEREIDWMALNGINLALAFNAQEAIWARTYQKLKLINDSYDFSGPAFLPWNRMGNMRVFGGGLIKSWHDNQLKLQHQILDRMRSLGITPVLPAFAGMLPHSYNITYPDSTFSLSSRWNGFSDDMCCPFLLDPLDPMFSVISKTFLEEYTKEFGTNHIYNCDTFNENDPSSNSPDYLRNISQAVYNGLKSFDSDAIWMIQGWMFKYSSFWGNNQIKAYLSGVPIGKLIVLDLQSDLAPQFQRTESYYGHPFIWCMLHNFGGQLGLYGFLEKINKGVVDGRTLENSTIVGIGLTPEGINTNYILYDFTLDSTFRDELTNVSIWVSDYAVRRYGINNKKTQQAWDILRKTVYSYGESTPSEGDTKAIIVERPGMNWKEETWYNRSLFFEAFEIFVDLANSDANLANSELFLYDLVDIARQAGQNLFSDYYILLINSYSKKDLTTFNKVSSEMLAICEDLDRVLATNNKFLLGRWLNDAKSFANNSDDSLYYEYNARNQITLWGPKGEIVDYAAKQWSGMFIDYYKPRWQTFMTAVAAALKEGEEADMNMIRSKIFIVEDEFTKDTKQYSTEPTGNTVQEVNNFYNAIKTWSKQLEELWNSVYSL